MNGYDCDVLGIVGGSEMHLIVNSRKTFYLDSTMYCDVRKRFVSSDTTIRLSNSTQVDSSAHKTGQ